VILDFGKKEKWYPEHFI